MKKIKTLVIAIILVSTTITIVPSVVADLETNWDPDPDDLPADLIPGDILFCDIKENIEEVTGHGVFGYSNDHCAMYIGNNLFIHSMPGRGVTISHYSEFTFWAENIVFGRVIAADDAIRNAAINWAWHRIGDGYQWNGSSDYDPSVNDNWNCAELIWAAYYNETQGNIDLDSEEDMTSYLWVMNILPDDDIHLFSDMPMYLEISAYPSPIPRIRLRFRGIEFNGFIKKFKFDYESDGIWDGNISNTELSYDFHPYDDTIYFYYDSGTTNVVTLLAINDLNEEAEITLTIVSYPTTSPSTESTVSLESNQPEDENYCNGFPSGPCALPSFGFLTTGVGNKATNNVNIGSINDETNFVIKVKMPCACGDNGEPENNPISEPVISQPTTNIETSPGNSNTQSTSSCGCSHDAETKNTQAISTTQSTQTAQEQVTAMPAAKKQLPSLKSNVDEIESSGIGTIIANNLCTPINYEIDGGLLGSAGGQIGGCDIKYHTLTINPNDFEHGWNTVDISIIISLADRVTFEDSSEGEDEQTTISAEPDGGEIYQTLTLTFFIGDSQITGQTSSQSTNSQTQTNMQAGNMSL